MSLTSAWLGFQLDAAKLVVPRTKRRYVTRSALLKRLTRAGDASVVSVEAPAGYGKTTLLAQWAARDRRAFAHVALDRRDNDPVVLMAYVAAALDAVYGIDPEVFVALATPDTSIWTTDLPRLVAAFAAAPRPLVLALDDVHELVERDCRDVVEALACHVPAGSQLALVGRSQVQTGAAKRRAQGALLELGAPELAFDDAEARTLLRRSGAVVDDAEARALNRRTEGWPAGLYLAALGSQDASRRAGEPVQLAGDDRLVADYLRVQHLRHVGGKRLRFLTRTSVLERLSGPLCDAVLECTGSARTLEGLERDNLFVLPLDHHRGWYRYHQLFREMLEAELRQTEPRLVCGLHRRAAAWYAANDMPEAAIDHAAAAGDLDLLAMLTAASTMPCYRSGRIATAERWLDRFDEPELLERYSAVAVLGAVAHALRGRPDDARRWEAAAARSTGEGPMPDGSPTTAWTAMLAAILCRAGVEQMRVDADSAAAQLAPGSPFKPGALALAGVGALLAGDSGPAEETLGDALRLALGQGVIGAGLIAAGESALLALARGDLTTAEARVRDGWTLVAPGLVADDVEATVLIAADARLAVARGDAGRARTMAATGQRMRPRLLHSMSWAAVQSRLELARVHLALADPDGARVLLREADAIVRRQPHVGILAEQLETVRDALAAVSAPGAGWASTLTAAELRLLPLLTTHLSFGEIAERLDVTRNTVKTQAISIYRKLDVSSRSEAIACARRLGLVDAAVTARAAAIRD